MNLKLRVSKNYLKALHILLIALPLILLFTVHGFAQHTISGTVYDDQTGEPLPGAAIAEEGTDRGTSTNLNGEFQFTASSGEAVLVIRFVGYEPKRVSIDDRSEIDIYLVPDVVMGSELVVTGYQIQRKVDLTGAISVANIDEIATDPNSNVLRSLQGRIPGLNITTDGSPANNATIRIRGESTLGNNAPLFVIDGVPSKTDAFQQLNPNEIESIQVLKDASASSIYGARASNGVIIISTKSGRDAGLQFSFNSSLSSQILVRRPQMLNTRQRGEVLWRAAINDGVNPNFLPIYDYDWNGDMNNPVLHDVIIPEWINEAQGIRSADTDWFDQVTQTGLISSNNMTVSTGDERGSVMASLNYDDNRGILKGTEFNRIAGRINSDYSFIDNRLNISARMQLSKTEENPMPFGQGGNPLYLAVRSQPILPVYAEDGSFAGPSGGGFSDRDNPVRVIEHNNWDRLHANNALGNISASFNVLDDLQFRTNFGVDYINRYHRFIEQTYETGFLSRDINSLTTVQEHNLSYTWTNTLNYQLDVGQNHFNMVGGMEAHENSFIQTESYSEEFTINENEYFVHNAATGVRTTNGFETGFALLSYFGRVNYNYADRYLGSATLRYDGSSRFGDANRYGLFPSLSLGWRISNESFFNIPAISELRLRGGWGNVGNQEIGNTASAGLFQARYAGNFYNGTAYDIRGVGSGVLPSGFVATQTPNPNLKWEETSEINLGFDIGLLEHRIEASFDYFFRETRDILIQPAYIAIMGEGGNQWVNGATVENWGFEAALTYRGEIGRDLLYRINANFGAYRDQITKLPESVIDSYPGNVEQNILGQSMHAAFGYVTDGIFKSDEEVDAHADQTGAAVGRIRYKDLNGDGVIDALDQQYLGVQAPDFEYGFGVNLNYRSFSFDMFLQGIYGMDLFYQNNDAWKVRTDFTGIWAGENYGVRTLNAWSPDNPDSNIPALSLSSNSEDPESRPSDYFLEDGSYLMLRNLQIGYQFPVNMMERLSLSELRVYFRAENVLQITSRSFTGHDPETPQDTYPRPLVLTLGFNISI